MSIFGGVNNMSMDEELRDFDMKSIEEAMIYDELSRLSDDHRQAFLVSEEASVMQKKGLIGKNTIVKLSKSDDLERRIGMISLQMAKDSNDILFDQLTKTRIREKEILSKINNKYEPKATRVAKVAQKDYLKGKIPVGFMRK